MIFVSIGHFPERPGACYRDFCEHGEASQWAGRLMHELGGEAATICPVGTLKEKVAFINETADKNDIAIEIHFNSAKNAEGEHIGRGSECLYHPNSKRGYDAAVAIQDALSKVFEPDRGVKKGYYQLNKQKGVDFFLAKTICTSVIIEPDFIHRKTKIRENRDAACSKIAASILAFMENENVG